MLDKACIEVDIWDAKPVKVEEDGGVRWTTDGIIDADGSYDIGTHLDFIPVIECRERFGTAPDNEHMIIKVGTP